MSWFKVDDKFHAHPKIKRIPKRLRRAAIGLWTLTGSWSADYETDGEIPDYMLDEFDAEPEEIDALVDVALWERTEGGVVFRNWDEFQPTKAQNDHRRSVDAERQRLWRLKKQKDKEAAEKGKRHAVTAASVTRDRSVSHADASAGTSERADSRAERSPWAEGESAENPVPTSGSRNGVTAPLVTEVSQMPRTRPDPTPSNPPTPQGELLKAPEPKSSKKRADYSEEFETAWKAFPAPGRQAKKVAAEAYGKARERADAATILAGIERYAAYVEKTDVKVKYMQGWLNADRWTDENAVQPYRNGFNRPTTAENVAAAKNVAAYWAQQEPQEVSAAGPNRRLSA